MNLHEYQGNEILTGYGVKTARGKPVKTAEGAMEAAKGSGTGPWVIKAQIHAGGRGKGGGVKLARTLDEVKAHASTILGMNLITKQTGPEGKLVRTVFVQEGCEIKKEFYLSMLVDRARAKVAIISSSEGGMEIEKVAAKDPKKITTTLIDPITGLSPHHCRSVLMGLNLPPSFFSHPKRKGKMKTGSLSGY